MKQKNVASLLEEEKSGLWENIVSRAPSIIGIFANFVVIFADIRVYDVIYQLTGIWWKALGASFACAVPFILWEIGWQYNHTTEPWRRASLAMAGLAFLTSIVLGVADYVGMTSPEWADFLLASVVVLTGVHTVVGFLYYYNDPDVARRRRKAQALAQMLDQETNADVAKQLLQSGKSLLDVIAGLEGQYDPEDVEAVLRILQGKKKDRPSENFRKNSQSRQNPTLTRQFASETGDSARTLPEAPTEAPVAANPTFRAQGK